MKLTKKILAVLLCLGLVLSCVPFGMAEHTRNEGNGGSLLLATLSDLHYYPASLSLYKDTAFYTYVQGGNCSYEDLNGVLDAALAALKADAQAKGLKYVVITGDLTLNGEYAGHAELAEKLKTFESSTGLKVFVQPGNHDINNSKASQFITKDYEKTEALTTSPTQFYELYKDLGFDDADDSLYAFDSGKAGSLSYAVSVDGGYRLIFPDAGKYSADNTKSGENEHETGGHMTEEVVEWVLRQASIAKQNGETPLLFTHWNLSEMNYMHGEVMQGFVMDNAYQLQEIFADAGIHFAFSGHQHVSDIDITYSDAGEVLYSVITPTLTQFPYQFRETALQRDATGKITADFQQYSVDVSQSVMSNSGVTYAAPYYMTTGFSKQYINNSASEYFLLLIQRILSNYIIQIKTDGSIVDFLKNRFGFDVEETIDNLIYGGLVFEDTPVFTTANIMAFINDLDKQIVTNFIYDENDPKGNTEQNLWALIRTTLEKLVDVQISEVPCTKFIGTYGFGDALRGGTLADLFFSAMVYMYVGNEDISDDLFIQDVIKQAGKTEFVDLIFNSVVEIVVKDAVLDGILGKVNVNIRQLFGNPLSGAATFIQGLYEIIAALIKEDFFKAGSLQDFTARLKALTAVIQSGKTTTYKYLMETVLSTGYISYGTTVDELAQSLLDKFFPAEAKEATAYQISVIADSIFNDPDRDYDVTYVYDGAVEVTPTQEDMQLPGDVNITYGDSGRDVSIRWLTKYSVTGTDLALAGENENLINNPVSPRDADFTTEEITISGYGFDFGTFGIMPWSRQAVYHEVSLKNLSPDTTYKFRIGDFDTGFTLDGSFRTASTLNGDFSFVLFSDAAATTPNGYQSVADTLKTAFNKNDNVRFAVNTGDSVVNADNFDQWNWLLNGAGDTLLNLPVINATGDRDFGTTGYINTLFSSPNAPLYSQTLYGNYRSFDYGTCHFAVINTNELSQDGTLSYGQTKWLTEDLEKSDADWKFIVMHEGVYDTLTVNEALKTQIVNLTQTYGVDMLLSGNDAAYARSHIISKGKPESESPSFVKNINGKDVLTYVDYTGFVSLSSGSVKTGDRQTSDTEYPDLAVAKAESRSVYSLFTVADDTLMVQTFAVNADGSQELLDVFALCDDVLIRRNGDIDQNGSIQAADARLALRYAVGLEPGLTDIQKLCADADGNKRIDAADARLILRAGIGLSKILPVYVTYNPNTDSAVNF